MRSILPQTMPGIVIGSIFIFVLTMGEYGTVQVISQGAVTTVGVYIHSSDRRHPVPAGGGVGGAARIHPDPRRVRDHPLLESARGHLMSSSAYAPAMERTQDSVVKRQYKPTRDWAKWGLAVYFVIFLIFLYAPMILMAILSFQGYYRAVSPSRSSGPAGLDWWRSIFGTRSITGSRSSSRTQTDPDRRRGLALGQPRRAARSSRSWPSRLSMAFRRRFRGDGIAFYIILLALMTPGFLLGLGTQIFWKTMNQDTSLWQTALGTNTVWGIPFGFLVMIGDLEPLRRPHRRGGARPRRQRGEDVRAR